jgi:hypothetical protein
MVCDVLCAIDSYLCGTEILFLLKLKDNYCPYKSPSLSLILSQSVTSLRPFLTVYNTLFYGHE